MIRWLFSKTIRDTCAYRKHIERLINARGGELFFATLLLLV
jgi:hypothetical protein